MTDCDFDADGFNLVPQPPPVVPTIVPFMLIVSFDAISCDSVPLDLILLP